MDNPYPIPQAPKPAPFLRSSSSAFAWGQLIFTDYNSGCLRYILLSSHVRTEIDPKYAIGGKLNEDRHESKLQAEDTHYVREREVERSSPIDGILVKGHVDFSIPNVRIDELKHVQSTNIRREVIRKGNVTVENLAQTVNYMWQVDVDTGHLIYTFYEPCKETGELTATEERLFVITIDSFGRILIDGTPSKFTIYDQFAHQAQAATALRDQTVAQRPVNWDAPFVSPCGFCKAQATCAKFDKGEIEGTESFIASYKQELTSQGVTYE